MRPTKSQIARFFAAMNKAAINLGHTSKECREGYYRLVVREVAGVDSVKDITSQSAYDECIKRFALDAGEFGAAIEAEAKAAKRLGFIIKVMAMQIIQLSGLPQSAARSYFEATLRQSRHGGGFHAKDEDFALDFSVRELRLFMQILDSHRRRLMRRYFPKFPLTFSPLYRFVCEPPIFSRIRVDEDYYLREKFTINFSR